MTVRPATARISLYGVTYEVDLAACRIRLLQRVAELSANDPRGGMQLVAEAAGVDRATLRRFFEGAKKLSVESFTSIITRGLLLDMATVATPVKAKTEAVA